MKNPAAAVPSAPTRPVRLVELPGGAVAHVRGLTLGELRRVDARAAADGGDPARVAIRSTQIAAAVAVCDAAGHPWYVDPSDAELDEVAELFTPDQLDALLTAAVGRGGKDAAKNG